MAITDNGNYSPSERIVSPGVFTREIDQSFLAQGVAAIGGVVVAPFTEGPGFSPTVVTSEADLLNIFGDPDGVLYGPITAQQYIRQQGQVTVCRVGGLGGYTQKNALIVSAIPGQYGRFSESGSFVGTVLNASYVYNGTSGSFTISGSLSLEFSSGIYSGSTVVVGNIAFITNAATTNSTGSTFVSTTTSSLGLATSHLAGPAVITTASLAVEAINACNNALSISGKLVGAYGALNPTDWVASPTSSEDACESGSIVTGRDEAVLAILANTAYDSGQNLTGFSGSVLLPKISTVVGSEFYLQLNNYYFDTDTNQYVNDSYGTYDFSLDEESTAYLTSVFGTDPKAGYYPVASGQKIEAAYTYKNFKYKTKQVVSEMLASGSWKIQISFRDNMTFSDGITSDVGTS